MEAHAGLDAAQVQPLAFTDDEGNVAIPNAGDQLLGGKVINGLGRPAGLIEKLHPAKPAERRALVAAGDEAQIEGARALPARHLHHRQGEKAAPPAEGNGSDVEQHAHPLTEDPTAPSMM